MKKYIPYIIGVFILFGSYQSFVEKDYLSFILILVAGLLCFPEILSKINNNFTSKYKIPIIILLTIIGANLKKTDNKEADVVVSENELKPILNEFPDFKYEIIGDLKGFSSNGVVKSDVVFIKVNSCDEEKLKYLQKELQKNNLFPPIFKSGKFEIKVFYEFKIFMVENIEQNVDLKNVKSLYDSSKSMVELNDYLRKNTKGFCAMLYKMWDLKTYPTYEENFGMFMRP
jgi:hypothetical protein